jgi:hypothetical protein
MTNMYTESHGPSGYSRELSTRFSFGNQNDRVWRETYVSVPSRICYSILMLGSAYFDPKSESRQQRVDRLAKEKEDGTRVEVDKGINDTTA